MMKIRIENLIYGNVTSVNENELALEEIESKENANSFCGSIAGDVVSSGTIASTRSASINVDTVLRLFGYRMKKFDANSYNFLAILRSFMPVSDTAPVANLADVISTAAMFSVSDSTQKLSIGDRQNSMLDAPLHLDCSVKTLSFASPSLTSLNGESSYTAASFTELLKENSE